MDGRQVVGTVIGTVIKVVVAAIILMFIYRYTIVAYDMGYRIFAESAIELSPGRDITITISDSDSKKDVAQLLESKGLVRDYRIFLVRAMISGTDETIAPGTYELNTSMTIEEMLGAMLVEKPEEPKEDTGNTP